MLGGALAARTQQQPDSLKKRTDTVQTARVDSLHQASDSLKLSDSLHKKADSLLKINDSLRKARADTLLSAAAMLRQVDSMNASPAGQVDSLKLKLDAQLNATANQRVGIQPGMPGSLARQGYSPGTGAGPGAIAPSTARAGPARRPTLRKPAELSNLHRKYIPVRNGRVPVDSSSLIPGAFFVKDVGDSAYMLDYINGALVWKHPPPDMDSVLVVYRTFPYRLNAVARRFNYDSIENYFLVRPYDKDKDGRNGSDNFFNFGNITYNGSFGRSITFGNNQDAVVTSNLNLQMSGYLADSIEISAAITDNNIPIQPDGTTADLNEFDKIFLQFKKKNWALTMGDIDLRQNQLYFLNFYKRLQGASFETTQQIAPKVTNRTLVSAAIAKGKFTRNIFQGQEGNQGPYKLQGANGELYFIVLAGTERVFIDGQLMQRGEDQDYVINYNTAEITFTPNRLISQDARIQVEFEYADRNYLNVNLYLFDEANFSNKLKVRVGLFSNSDSRNSPINQTLTPDQNKFLAKLGDSIQHAFYPVANIDTFAAGKILYKKVDTTYKDRNGVLVHDSVYVFSTDKTQTLYSLSFANVGQGYGNYLPDLNGVNGNVYYFVAPVNGVMQGSYEAAEFLVTPKTQQVMSVGADYAIDKHSTVMAELAHSHYDINTLSTIQKNNDDGNAMKFTFKNIKPLGPAAKGLVLTATAGFEYVQKQFAPLERLRSPEFTRDWGLSLYVNPADEKIYNASLMLSDKKLNSIKYEAARYERGDGFTGMRNSITQRQHLLGWDVNDQVSLTTSDSSHGWSGYYLKPSVNLSRKLPFLKNYVIGGGYSLEQNVNKSADTMTATSFAFHTWTAFLKSPEKAPNKWGVSFAERTNAYPYGQSLLVGDRSKTWSAFADLMKNPHHQFHINVSYRQMEITNSNLAAHTVDSSTVAQGGDKTLLGRMEYVINEWKGFLRGNLLYEIGSGQQQRLSYTYLQVPAGTGQYAWIDYNHDGIQQLSEFVLAQFPDQAQYIRVYTPTNEYVKANYNTFNYSFSINPKAIVSSRDGSFAQFLARVLFQSSMQLTQKQQARGIIEYNPFAAPLNDTALITRTMILVNTLSFNRTDPHWGFDLSNTRNGGKTLLTYGYETRQTNEWSIRTRLNVTKSVMLTGVFRSGTNQLNNSSTNFDSSNYDLKQWSMEPGLTYTRRSNLRIGMGFKLTAKQNALEWGGQKYTSDAFNADFKYNILQSTSIQGKFTMSSILYTAKDGSPSTTSAVSYTILEGLAPGKNYLWNLDLTKKLGGSLELSLQYEGRKAGNTGIVHTGRAALRALL
ncbi:hypothetical protein [Puia dinghuensis]|uniref:Uncharacterized protein n=1 Tax=Puia dinghuensis TaxID=1792502 RepID=A0A8J2U6N7_9BACT|nr:hypothetical protein [Puia dinghuensis]GGA82549.1 hypothetical protein GCM10011511_01910 [Puia dinghuensis]